jgi:thioredoxin-dependent peroxiredoxin
MLAIGSKAPDFKLARDTGEIVRLRDLYGKKNAVITFFPNGLSANEMEDTYLFLQHLQKTQEIGVEVIIICPKNIDELQKLLRLYSITLPIAFDPTLEVCRNYHAFWLRGLGLRKITYVIDKKGIIRGRLSHHLFTEKSWGNVLRLLQELAVVATV